MRQGRHALVIQAERFGPFLGHQTGHGASGQGLGHEAPGVMSRARAGHEGIAWSHGAAIQHQALRTEGAQPLQGLLHAVQVQHPGGHHQKLSSTAGTLATICDFTSASGGTFSRRSVCPTTWLNTGAATAPP